MKTRPRLIRETLRLNESGSLSSRAIARLVCLSHNTVHRYCTIAQQKQLTVKAIDALNDEQLLAHFHTKKRRELSKRLPDWTHIHKLMQQKHQTLIQLWEEYHQASPDDAYSYSQFASYYRRYLAKVDLTMRQVHYAGEAVYVDYAGRTIPWMDSKTGEAYQAQIFVGVLGCSNYTFVWASKSQKLHDWIDAHNRMFRFFDGVPQVVVPDNLKSAVTKAGRDEILNRTYQDMAKHYGCVVVPARVRKPQDKSKAELGVLLATRWITVPLRRRQFFSVEEINEAIAELLPKMNERSFKKLSGSRLSRFNELDKPALQPLPKTSFEFAQWVTAQKVGRDYHLYVDGHAYSVPYHLVGERVEARLTSNTVEFFHLSQRVTVHVRSFTRGEHTTNPNHRPAQHQAYAKQSLKHFLSWAQPIGEYTIDLVKAQFHDRAEFSIAGCRACSQLQQLARVYGSERFEAACRRASDIGSLTVKSVRSILQHKLDKPRDKAPVQTQLPLHHNVRGSDYYQQGGA